MFWFRLSVISMCCMWRITVGLVNNPWKHNCKKLWCTVCSCLCW